MLVQRELERIAESAPSFPDFRVHGRSLEEDEE
jgi:hypothetical protein